MVILYVIIINTSLLYFVLKITKHYSPSNRSMFYCELQYALFIFKFYFTHAKEEQKEKKLSEDSRSSLYPSLENVLGRYYIALKRFHRKGRLTM